MSDEVLCLGDVNINVLNFNDRRVVKLTQAMDDADYCRPTRVTAHSSTFIDLVIVVDDAPIMGSGVLEIRDIADHILVHCKLDLESEHSHLIEKSCRSLLI